MRHTGGAGEKKKVDRQNRQHAGVTAETGVTGLALLALLGAGHTHEEGDYQGTVQRGLEFLLNSQRANGSLAGRARPCERTYCDAMATFALAEALAMTGDERLGQRVQLAVDYLVSRQHPTGGGWRYNPGDVGDTSQLGWVIMALRSAEIGGADVPSKHVGRASNASLVRSLAAHTVGWPPTAQTLARRAGR